MVLEVEALLLDLVVGQEVFFARVGQLVGSVDDGLAAGSSRSFYQLLRVKAWQLTI